jgi:hypothetical protein
MFCEIQNSISHVERRQFFFFVADIIESFKKMKMSMYGTKAFKRDRP